MRTPRGEIAAGHVVIAAGPWARPVGRLAGLDLPVTPSRESIVTLRPAFDWSPVHPVSADLANEVYLRPETGGLILVGSTRDSIVPGDPDAYEDRPGADDTAEMVTRLARFMPEAASAAITGGWSGMYEVSPDWNPIMGTARDVAGLHYAVGFSGHGFKLSPVIGILMAEQVLDGRARTDRHRALPPRAVPGGPGAAGPVPGRRRHGLGPPLRSPAARADATETTWTRCGS